MNQTDKSRHTWKEVSPATSRDGEEIYMKRGSGGPEVGMLSPALLPLELCPGWSMLSQESESLPPQDLPV